MDCSASLHLSFKFLWFPAEVMTRSRSTTPSAAALHALSFQLGPGTFLMGKGNYVAVTKGVVLRGAGPGVTFSQESLEQTRNDRQ